MGFQHAKAERDRPHQQLSALNAALEAFAAAYLGNAVTKPRRKLAAQGRARHCSSSEITLGKGQGAAEGCSNCTSSDARQANDASIGSSQDRSGSTSKVGEGQSGATKRLRRVASASLSHPAPSVMARWGHFFDFSVGIA
jgi:hypothetical protein